MSLSINSIFHRLVESLWQTLPANTFKLFPGNRSPKISITWPTTYSWPMAAGWLEPIREGFTSFIAVYRADLASPYPGVYHFDLTLEDTVYRIAVDNADHTEVNPAQASDVFVYFKMQYKRGGYGLPNVFPGGFVPWSQNIYRYLPYLRQLRDQQRFDNDVACRFGFEFAESIRRNAIERLSSQNKLKYSGGNKVRYSHSLCEVARSRVCIDLPGNGPLCFRLIDYFAIGSCVIAYPHQAELPQPLIDGVHIVYMKEDLSDLVELCEYYSCNSSERERIQLESRLYFDRFLNYQQLARYYLSTILEHIVKVKQLKSTYI